MSRYKSGQLTLSISQRGEGIAFPEVEFCDETRIGKWSLSHSSRRVDHVIFNDMEEKVRSIDERVSWVELKYVP